MESRKSEIRQDMLTDNAPHPIYDGRAITIRNVGTHRLFVGNVLVIPGTEWVASNDARDVFQKIPVIRFEKDEWRDFQNVSEKNLPSYLTTKGKMATIQYIKDIQ